jgi:hypothetical protein
MQACAAGYVTTLKLQLVSWTVVGLTAAKFKPLILPMPGFSLYIWIYMVYNILYQFLTSIISPSPPWFNDRNKIMWKVQIMKLPIISFSPLPCCFHSLTSQHFPQYSKALDVSSSLLHNRKVRVSTGLTRYHGLPQFLEANSGTVPSKRPHLDPSKSLIVHYLLSSTYILTLYNLLNWNNIK